MEREQTAYRPLLPLEGALPADPQPSPLRLLRGCIAMPFTAGVRAVASRHRLADAVKGGELSGTAADSGGPGQPKADRKLRLVRGLILMPFLMYPPFPQTKYPPQSIPPFRAQAYPPQLEGPPSERGSIR